MEKTTQRLTSSIEYLCNLNMKILAIKEVSSANNKKDVYQNNIPTGWKTKMSSINELKKQIKTGCEGFIIRTGKLSNILVVDYDNKTCTNPELIKMLKDSDTLTIDTPNSGKHFIFKYDDKYLKKCKRGLFNNIDIRSDGGMLFFGTRSDGEYIIEDMNKSIKKCPCEIIILLRDYVNIPRPEELLKKQKIQKVDDIIKAKDGYKFIISYDEIYALLSYLPPVYIEQYVNWFVITTILKDESGLYDDSDIDKQKYYNAWNKWSANNTEKYDKTKNDIIWRNLKTTDTYIDMRYILNIIIHSKIDKPVLPVLDRLYQDFEPLTKSRYTNIININDKYLTTSLITTDDDYIFKSGLGTGKTTSAFTYAKEQNIPIISICSLKTVINSQSASYFDITGKELVRYDDPELRNKYAVSIKNNEPISIVTTIDSFYIIAKLINNNIEKYVFFVDEAHSVLEYFLMSSTLASTRDKNFTSFGYALKYCMKIICADGDICDNVMTYIKKLNRESDIILVINTFKSFDKVKAHIITKEQNIQDRIFKILEHNKIQTDPSKKKGATVCCNTLKRVEELKQTMIKNKYNMEDVICYTSRDGYDIKNINKEWKNKVILYSPSIVQGLDFKPDIAQPVFVYFQSAFTINPLQVSQQICRNRNISEVFIYIDNMPNEEPFKDITETREHIMSNIDTFKKLNKQIVNTTTSITSLQYADNDFTELYEEYVYQDRIIKSNCSYNLYKILSLKGFDIIKPIITICSCNIPQGLTARKKMKDAIKKANNILYQKYVDNTLIETDEKYKSSIDNTLKYYSIPTDTTHMNDDDKLKHKIFLIDNETILSNPKAIKYYYAITLLIGQNPQHIESAIKKRMKDDYLPTIHTATCYKVKGYLDIISKYLSNIINPLAFSYITTDKRLLNPISITEAEFSFIKSIIISTKDKPTNIIELLELLIFVARDIFGDVIIKEKKKETVDKTLSKEEKAKLKLAKGDNKTRANITKFIWDTKYVAKYIVLLNYYNEKNKDPYIPIVLNDIIKSTEPATEKEQADKIKELLIKMHEFLGITDYKENIEKYNNL